MNAEPARVMVVEDDPDLMRIISRILEAAGLRVLQAYGAEDALRKLKLKVLDLILTDLAMPKMSGAQLIRVIKNDPDTLAIPCVAVTAFLWDNMAQSAAQAGCDGYVAKPFTSERLLTEVARFVSVPGRDAPVAAPAPPRRVFV